MIFLFRIISTAAYNIGLFNRQCPVFTGDFFCNLCCRANRLIVNAILFFIQKNTNNQFILHRMGYWAVTSAELIAGVIFGIIRLIKFLKR